MICGATAAGKSALAMAIAERRRLVVVSADSRQVYRGFDVGTAKPTPEERARVPHRGIDVAEPTERWSAARWAEDAAGWVADDAQGTPVVVGGTGLYIRALVEPLFDEPPLDAARRQRLQEWLDAQPTELLRRWCERLDPARAALGRTQLLRALEVALLTGRRISELHTERGRVARRDARYLLVDPGRERLVRWIAERVDRMIAGGWPEEVERLLLTVPPDAPAWNATGYDAIRRLVRGEIGRERAVEEVTIATRQYAKRQRTWFRHQLDPARVTVVDPTAADATERAVAWFEADGSDGNEGRGGD